MFVFTEELGFPSPTQHWAEAGGCGRLSWLGGPLAGPLDESDQPDHSLVRLLEYVVGRA